MAKESKSLIEIQTEKLILRIEKKNGAIQYFDADRKLLVSENATEPRLLNNGECYTFFDWDKSEKLKSKGILATDLTDLTKPDIFRSEADSRGCHLSCQTRDMELLLHQAAQHSFAI